MVYRTLVTTDVLARNLDNPAFLLVDCRFKLGDGAWGEREYEAAHIAGAVYAHLDRDLSGPKSGTNGRHPLPEPRAAAATFSRFGIGDGVQVVAYDEDTGMFAGRLWWMLRWLGHDAAAVLDGGFAKWRAEGRPTVSGRETRPAKSFAASPRDEMVVDAAAVASRLHDSAAQLLDARAPERYRGETEPLDRVPGHIPGAVNHFFQTNLGERGTFRSPEELRTRFRDTIGDDAARVICYCGSGVSACHNLLALEHAGLSGAKLYPGSWSEWSSDPQRPIETGPVI